MVNGGFDVLDEGEVHIIMQQDIILSFKTIIMIDQEKGLAHSEERHDFATKVYGITSGMLILTTIFTIIFYDTTGKLANNSVAIILSIVGTFGIIIALTCFRLSQKVPINYILLSVFSICQSVLLAISCSYYETTSVMIAFMMTAVMTSVLTVYAWNTKRDLSILYGILLVALVGLIFTGILLMFFNIGFLHSLYCLIGAIIFGIYIVVDVQMIEGRMKEKYELDDYVGGAMNLYLDILNLFLQLLKLLGKKKN